MSSQGSVLQRPRAFVRLNGKQTRLLDFNVENKSHFQCDTFDLTLEAWQQPDGFGLDYWGDDANTSVMAEILFGYLADEDDANAIPATLSSLIIGQVDDVDPVLPQGTIKISGRDLTARLIDTKIAKTWPDHTSSQIVTDLANQVGLTPNVTATTTPSGKYSKGAYASLGREMPMWDLITYLAEQEGFDAYVTGTTLYFGPPPAESDNNPFTITVTRPRPPGTASVNVVELKPHRSLTLAKDITVTVISHNTATGRPINAIAKRSGSPMTASTSVRTGNTAQNYVIRRPNLTQQQALQLAQQTLDDISKHERTLDFTNAIDPDLTTRRKVRLTGSNTTWDTDYFIDTITRRYSFGSADMTVSAKNHPTESEPDL